LEDVLVVTKLDRLGRNAMDVRAKVERMAEMKVRVHCLALGGVDLTSAAGKMTMAVIAAVAEFERDLLVERTQAGLARARSQGTKLGRPASLTREQLLEVRARRQRGEPLRVTSGASTFLRDRHMRAEAEPGNIRLHGRVTWQSRN